MSTPYDNKILLVNWMGSNTPGPTVAKLAKLLRAQVPNVAGIMLKTSNGINWQGNVYPGDADPKAITGVTRIQEWVDAFAGQGLEVHVWGVPRAKRPAGEKKSPDIQREADKFIAAVSVAGVKSLLLDVETGDYYWQGTPDEANQLMTLIRGGVPADTHIGLILDGRRPSEFAWFVDPWVPFVDSLHPMVYPVMFGRYKSIEQHLDEQFQNLRAYGKPLCPMLQTFADQLGGRPTPEDITRQGNSALARGAAGLSFFRLGSDKWGGDKLPQMGDPEYAAIAAVTLVPQARAVTYTWRDVINATCIAAIRAGEKYDVWLDTAGFWGVFQDALRGQPYSGPPVEQWPLPSNRRQAILDLLQRSSIELIRLLQEARLTPQPLKAKQRGAIVGIHGAPGVAAPPQNMWDTWINSYLKEMGVKWYKQCDHGGPDDTGPGSILEWAKRLKQAGIEPIIRYLATEQFPDPLPDHYFQRMQQYAQAGIVWAEIGNEPNLDIEWKSNWRDRPDRPVSQANPEAIRLIAETWVHDAQRALTAGVRPAFYAFAPTDWRGRSNPQYSSVFFTQKVVQHLAEKLHDETLDIFNRGGWIAVHAATFEQPFDFNPFAQGNVVWDMTLRSYEVVLKAFRDSFGNALNVDDLVVMSTEGGVFTYDSTSMEGHYRLQTDEEHAARVAAMFPWLEAHSPLQAMCPWCVSVGDLIGHWDDQFRFDGWIQEINGVLCPRPVFDSMRQLRFDNERANQGLTPAYAGIKLDVPYISQWDETAWMHNADCGPACIAMLLNAGRPLAEYVTVDDLYAQYLPNKEPREFTYLPEMLQLGQADDLNMVRRDYSDGPTALQNLHSLIEQNTPFVALVNYAKWDEIAKNNFKLGHFVVVTGCDDEYVFVHDPLFRGERRNLGAYFVWKNDKFLDGWGSGQDINNPNFTALIPDRQVGRV